MNSSDSEYFESADEEFETDKGAKPSTLEESTLNIEKLELKDHKTEDKRSADLDGHKNVDKKKPRPKLGTKLGTKIAKPAVSISVSNIETKTSNKANLTCKKDVEEIQVEGKSNSWVDTKISNSTVNNSTFNVKTKMPNETNPTSRDNIKEIQQLEDEPNLWEDDDWETTPNGDDIPTSSSNTPINNQTEPKTNLNNDLDRGWSSWGTWGVSSLLSTASSITTQLSQGLTTALESSIGAPDPVALAKQDLSETTTESSSEPIFDINNLISGVTQITKLVETTGTKVISGGLDTLETIGKKTMEVLQEGDPGFKKKRAFLKIEGEKPVLSQLLREAKEKAEHDNKILEQKHLTKKANYEMLFDDHQGLMHLEALEMLSKQCDIKLQTILESKSGSDLIETQETMEQIKELCELNEDDEEEPFNFDEIEEILRSHVSELNINISYDKLVRTWSEAESWFNNVNLSVCSEMELHEQAIDTLAQVTAISVEQFHKTGELLLIKQHRSTVDEADSLVQLTTLLTNLISYIAKTLCVKLNEKSPSCKSKENVNNFITNIYFEAANSSSYIKNAFQLLIPVLQVGAL